MAAIEQDGAKERPPTTPLSMDQVLREEARLIDDPDMPEGLKGVWLDQRMAQLDRSALCISGGGIRSATFALGVIQALASYPRNGAGEVAAADKALLGRFRFLSTVSGGGYIGSWLSAWLRRQSFADVQCQLAGRPLGPEVEPAPIRHLRQDSNYLTPKIGLTSADTWTAAAMVGRNLFLNWLLVLSALAVLLLGLKFVLVFLSFVGASGPMIEGYYIHTGLLAFGTLALIFGQRFTLTNYSDEIGDGGGPLQFLCFDLLPAIVGAIAITTWAVFPIGLVQWAPNWLNVMLVGPTIFIASGLLSYPAQLDHRHNFLLRLVRWVFSGVIWSAIVLIGICLLVLIDYAPARLLTLAVLGPPWFLMAQITAETIYVAATSNETRSDSQREWLARSAGWFVVAGVGWTALTVLGLLGSRLIDLLRSETFLLYHSLIGGSLAGTAAIGLFAGQNERPTVVSGFTKLSRFVQLLGGQLFLALVLIITSSLVDRIVLGGSLLDALLGPAKDLELSAAKNHPLLNQFLFGDRVEVVFRPRDLMIQLSIGLVIAFVVAWVVSRTVNINRFSLHDLYRNRLVRAYLGATHRDRHPNPFTGFDLQDNPLMHELWPQRPPPDGAEPVNRLFHVVNCTLNVVSSRNPAWQQRKAMSYTITPLCAGAGDLTPRGEGRYGGAFQLSQWYGGKKGISLGTAMAISGAAANPAMGYNSAPSITLLFALFNVRLGWWLANPGPQGRSMWRLSGPRQALVPWLQEAFGQTTGDRAYVNLSDGGHFENLALYEMVRRRCRVIVLSDGGCDPDFNFADLGNAVRKIRIDLGVCITFPHLDQLQPRIAPGAMAERRPYWTVGRIHYRDADGAGEDGYILYIKPSYHGTEGAGIRAYANESPTFPHESTADQWFSEAQFESYRSLGFQIVEDLLTGLDDLPENASLLDIVKAVQRQTGGSEPTETHEVEDRTTVGLLSGLS